MKYHPDRGVGSSEAKFKEAKEAFEFLEKDGSNASSKQKTTRADTDSDGYRYYYDPRNSGTDSKDSWNSWGKYNKQGYTYDYDDDYSSSDEVFSEVTITLKQAFNGDTVDTAFGKVKIPDGIWNEDEFVDYKSDVSFEVRIDQPGFKVNWNSSDKKHSGDVHTSIKLSVLRLMMGGWVNFENFEGSTLNIYVPPGTNVDSTLRVRGKGYNKSSTTNDRGNLYVKISATVESVDKLDPVELEEFIKATKK